MFKLRITSGDMNGHVPFYKELTTSRGPVIIA